MTVLLGYRDMKTLIVKEASHTSFNSLQRPFPLALFTSGPGMVSSAL